MRKFLNARSLSFEQLETRTLLDGAVYFVSTSGNDSSDGLTAATAWRTVWRATRNASLKPGDTINVLPGVYANDGISTLANGTADHPITVRAVGGTATLQGGVITNAWTLYDAASNVYVLDVDSSGVTPYWTFCGYTTTAFGYGAMTNVGSTFQGVLADPAGNSNVNCDPSGPYQLFNPPPALANKCFFLWTGSLLGNYVAGTKIYLHAPPGWTQQDVSANVFVGDATKSVGAHNSNWVFDHLEIANAYNGFYVTGENVTITGCTIRNISYQSCLGGANGLVFEHNLVESVGQEYTPAASASPAVTISKLGDLPQAVKFSHDVDGNLRTALIENGATVGNFRLSPSQTLADLAEFLRGFGYTVSVVGDPARSCQFLVNSGSVDVSVPRTFQWASWSLKYPYGSWYHGVYFGGNNSTIANNIFRNINGNGISYRYGNNFSIANNLVDNDLGGLLNAGGSNIAVYNNVFRSTVDAGNGINLGYGGNGRTIEFEPNTVFVSDRTTSGFFETAGGAGCSNWSIADNIFENILSSGSPPIEMKVSTTPDATFATWNVHDNVYWIGDATQNPLAFRASLYRVINGVPRNEVYPSWSDYYAKVSQLWGWERGSMNVNPQLDADGVPQNPAVIAMGVGAVLKDAATWAASSDGDLRLDNVAGPLPASTSAVALGSVDPATVIPDSVDLPVSIVQEDAIAADVVAAPATANEDAGSEPDAPEATASVALFSESKPTAIAESGTANPPDSAVAIEVLLPPPPGGSSAGGSIMLDATTRPETSKATSPFPPVAPLAWAFQEYSRRPAFPAVARASLIAAAIPRGLIESLARRQVAGPPSLPASRGTTEAVTAPPPRANISEFQATSPGPPKAAFPARLAIALFPAVTTKAWSPRLSEKPSKHVPSPSGRG